MSTLTVYCEGPPSHDRVDVLLWHNEGDASWPDPVQALRMRSDAPKDGAKSDFRFRLAIGCNECGQNLILDWTETNARIVAELANSGVAISLHRLNLGVSRRVGRDST